MSARIRKQSLVLIALLLTGTFAGPALFSSGPMSGQGWAQATSFRARLSPLPVDGRLFRTVTGVGQVRATLAGNRLTLTGTYTGMSSPATRPAGARCSATRGEHLARGRHLGNDRAQ